MLSFIRALTWTGGLVVDDMAWISDYINWFKYM